MTGRKRGGVRATAVVTAAMAALTASQAPGPTARASAPAKTHPAPPGPSVSGDTPYRTEFPPLRTRGAAGGTESAEGSGGPVGGALPATVLAAYLQAEEGLADSRPDCRLRWQLLAAIGQVESGQARGGRVTADGTTLTPILGPRLDGNGFAAIRDTDSGVYDGDVAYDRAVGPMQFIPTTWAVWGSDGNGDGHRDPGNIYDASLAAGRYLCAGGRDLSDAADLDRAILGYNHSTAYVRTVRAWFAYYLEGHRVVPDNGSGPAVRPKPKPSDTSRQPVSSAAPARPGDRDGGPKSSPTPTSSPSPSKSAGGGAEPEAPLLPVPSPIAGLPGVGALTSNGKDSMRASPSTTPATGR
ncbi:lytic transglycosylase domain-containing protein [Streptomyces lunaelactis]|uniref:lytic transglycosylase domain-containing protein n=1 Tax=Streptomyces lunaelactis TaxID=1535768 RepID=UPI00158510B0|nr:lytic transglycosylase domain-containing protein [Streptomyces lunaelactis]NUK50801.1 lytic transglycosylase domain-containing protein [Streptomyces lunaelactis]NUK63113.1 lytic transglycosylase domain-containing protein [Streptomyces lunaelactis]